MLVSGSMKEALLLQDSSSVLTPFSWYFYHLIPKRHLPFCSLVGSTLVSYGTKMAPLFMLFFVIDWWKRKHLPLCAFSWDRVTAVPGGMRQMNMVAQGSPYGHRLGLSLFISFTPTSALPGPANVSQFIQETCWPRLKWTSTHSFCTGILTIERNTSASPLPSSSPL